MKATTQLFRCYTIPDENEKPQRKSRRKKKAYKPSAEELRLAHLIAQIGAGWSGPVLVFDCETMTDANSGQALRFGVYQYRKMKYTERVSYAKRGTLTRDFLDRLSEEVIFYNPKTCTDTEIECMIQYGKDYGLPVMTVDVFIDEVFYKPQWIKCASKPEDRLKEPMLVIGHNLPFDLGCLSKRAGLARGDNYGGLVLHFYEEEEEDAGAEAERDPQTATDGDEVPQIAADAEEAPQPYVGEGAVPSWTAPRRRRMKERDSERLATEVRR